MTRGRPCYLWTICAISPDSKGPKKAICEFPRHKVDSILYRPDISARAAHSPTGQTPGYCVILISLESLLILSRSALRSSPGEITGSATAFLPSR